MKKHQNTKRDTMPPINNVDTANQFIGYIKKGDCDNFSKQLKKFKNQKLFLEFCRDKDDRNILQLIALWSRKNDNPEAYRKMFSDVVNILGKDLVQNQVDHQNNYGNTVLHYLHMKKFKSVTVTKKADKELLKTIQPYLDDSHVTKKNRYGNTPAIPEIEIIHEFEFPISNDPVPQKNEANHKITPEQYIQWFNGIQTPGKKTEIDNAFCNRVKTLLDKNETATTAFNKAKEEATNTLKGGFKACQLRGAYQNEPKLLTEVRKIKNKPEYSKEDVKNFLSYFQQLGLFGFPVINEEGHYTLPINDTKWGEIFVGNTGKEALQSALNEAAQKIADAFHTHVTKPLDLPKDRVNAISTNIVSDALIQGSIDNILKGRELSLLFGIPIKAELFVGSDTIEFGNLHKVTLDDTNPKIFSPSRISKAAAGIDVDEAPYNKQTFYQAVADRKTAVIVSLTTDKDSVSRGMPVDLHHIKNGETVQVDGYNFKGKGKRTVTDGCTKREIEKTNTNNNNKTAVYHYYYNAWPDGEDTDKCAADMLKIISDIITQHPNQKPNLRVHCKQGLNRSRKFAAAWKLVSDMVYFGKHFKGINEYALADTLDQIDKDFCGKIGGCNNEKHKEFNKEFAKLLSEELEKGQATTLSSKIIKNRVLNDNTLEDLKISVQQSFLEKLQNKPEHKDKAFWKECTYTLSESFKQTINAEVEKFHRTVLKNKSALQQAELIKGFEDRLFKWVKDRNVTDASKNVVKLKNLSSEYKEKGNHEISGDFCKVRFGMALKSFVSAQQKSQQLG